MGNSWCGADEGALSWLRDVATDGGDTGYDVRPMPDKVFVLHPLSERIDGKAIADEQTEMLDDGTDTRLLSAPVPEPPTRSVRWDDYARRRNIPIIRPGAWPGWLNGLPGVMDDEYVSPPDEGHIGDPATRRALFEVLVRHSERGPETVCTAFYYWLPVADPRPGAPTVPNVRRGPLGAYEELFDGPSYCSPQNLWPDDHKWVLQTDWDSWATAVSGPTALIEDIIASPALEAVRLPHLG